MFPEFGDNSAATIQRAIDDNGWQSWCSFVVSKTNLGSTGGNNLLIRPALESADPADFVLLLNPDTVVRPYAFTALLDFMDRNPSVGIAGSRLEDPDGTPQRSAFRFISPLGEFEGQIRLGPVTRLLSRWVVAPHVVDNTCETDWVAGVSMIVRRAVFDQAGLLDEGYFTYFDDIDFCFTARKRGWSQPGTCPQAALFISSDNRPGSMGSHVVCLLSSGSAASLFLETSYTGLCRDGRCCHDHRTAVISVAVAPDGKE